jgi:hypothetical protein
LKGKIKKKFIKKSKSKIKIKKMRTKLKEIKDQDYRFNDEIKKNI